MDDVKVVDVYKDGWRLFLRVPQRKYIWLVDLADLSILKLTPKEYEKLGARDPLWPCRPVGEIVAKIFAKSEDYKRLGIGHPASKLNTLLDKYVEK